MKHFIVKTKSAHVGYSKTIIIEYAICAENGKEAAKIARSKPRAKHDHYDVIVSCTEVSYSDYLYQLYDNENDPYLKCSNRQEQNRILEQIESRIIEDTYYLKDEIEYTTSRKPNLKYQSKKYSQDEDYEYLF